MDSIDGSGRETYLEYMRATQKWIRYVTPIATEMVSEYIKKSGKTYYKYEYIRLKAKPDNKPDKNIKIVYNRLALKLHPDKFHHELNNGLFDAIVKHYMLGNISILSALDDISETILLFTTDRMKQLIETLSIDAHYTRAENILKAERKADVKTDEPADLRPDLKSEKIISILLRDNPNSTPDGKPVDIDTSTAFMSSTAYSFFINPEAGGMSINNMYYTEDELLAELANSPNSDLFNFYATHYSHNARILDVVAARLIKERERLLRENETLKELKLQQELLINHNINNTNNDFLIDFS